jgi:hypothetical protein
VIAREGTRAQARDLLASIAAELDAALKEANGDVTIGIEVRITRKKP